MDNKKRYYGLDDIGIIGVQVKRSAALKRYHEKRTGEIIRAYKMGLSDAKKTSAKKKVS
jgi:hypothetical protein